MGIKNLSQFLRDTCPDLYKPIHLSEYAFKKVAIDTSLYMHKFKYIYQDKWLRGFLGLVSCLRKNEIHCVFIYDTSAPKEKEGERAERAKQREKTENELAKLKSALEKYNTIGEVDEALNSFISMPIPNVSLFNIENQLELREPVLDIDAIEAKINRLETNILSIRPEDFQLTKDLFDILRIPYYNAPMEAETACSDLCQRGLVDAVLSEDTDVLAYGAPIFLTKIDTNQSICYEISFTDLLSKLDIDKDAFLDFCIMCGCDYNKNIPKIGSKTAFKLMKQYNSIENLSQAKKDLDISMLNHTRTRELFREYTPMPIDYVPFSGRPDFEALSKLFKDRDIEIDISKVERNFTNEIVIVES